MNRTSESYLKRSKNTVRTTYSKTPSDIIGGAGPSHNHIQTHYSYLNHPEIPSDFLERHNFILEESNQEDSGVILNCGVGSGTVHDPARTSSLTLRAKKRPSPSSAGTSASSSAGGEKSGRSV